MIKAVQNRQISLDDLTVPTAPTKPAPAPAKPKPITPERAPSTNPFAPPPHVKPGKEPIPKAKSRARS